VEQLDIHPVTPEQWDDFETLFGPRGAVGGCWCMWFRQKRSEYEQLKGEGNHRAMQAIVQSGEVPGLLAYSGGVPVAWVSVAPRQAFPSLNRSPVLKRVDDQPVWSVVCFFIARKYRRQKLSGIAPGCCRDARQIKAHRRGSLDRAEERQRTDTCSSHGFTFRRAGFVEVARRRKPAQSCALYLTNR
jgi:hypothetical protein